jgi:hypothetical protein
LEEARRSIQAQERELRSAIIEQGGDRIERMAEEIRGKKIAAVGRYDAIAAASPFRGLNSIKGLPAAFAG